MSHSRKSMVRRRFWVEESGEIFRVRVTPIFPGMPENCFRVEKLIDGVGQEDYYTRHSCSLYKERAGAVASAITYHTAKISALTLEIAEYHS